MKNILDGELLNKYLYLSMMERSELAKKIGTTQDIVGRSGQGGVGALRLNVLLLPRFWRTSWTWTGSPLTSESLAPPRVSTLFPLDKTMQTPFAGYFYVLFCIKSN